MNETPLEPLVRRLRRLVEAHSTKNFSDAQLLEQFVRTRDEAAFAGLMCRHGGLVWHVCRQVLHHEQDAEDAFQACFLVLALKAASLHREQGLGNWLYGVAYRVAMNAKRKAARRQAHESRKAAAAPPTLPDALALQELQSGLLEEIHRLPEKYRVPLVLCGLEGKSKSEAARELGWKEGTVSGRLARARRMLAGRLARRGVLLSAAWAATTVSAESGAAVIPTTLVKATAEAARQLAGGQALTTGIVSNPVATLVKEALKTMSATRLKLALTFVLGLVLLGTSLGMPAKEAFRGEPTPPGGDPPANANDTKPGTQANHPRVDLQGDPLPQGAVARLGTMRFRQYDIEVMGLSPDGRVLITKSCSDGRVCAWEADSGKLLWQNTPSVWGANRNNGLLTVSFSPDGRFVAEICDCRPADGMAECILLCDLKDGKELFHFPAEGSFKSVWETVFSPDSKCVAANIEGTIYRWSTESGRLLDPTAGAIPADAVIRFSADGKTIIAVSDGQKVSHWDVARRAVTRVVELRAKQAHGHQAVSDDGRLVAVAAGQSEKDVSSGAARPSTLQLFDTTTGKECCTFQGDDTGIQALVLSHDGRTLIGVSPGDGQRLSTISVWDTRIGKLRHRFPLRLDTAYHIGVTPDGGKLFTSISSNHGWLAHGPGESVVRWWDAATGKELMTKPAHEDRVESVCFTPDRRFLLSAANDASVRIWDIAGGRSLHRVPEHYASSLAIVSAQGTFLSGGGDDQLDLFDWRTGQRLHRLVVPPEPDGVPALMKAHNSIQAFVVSPDGREATSLRACYRGVLGDAAYFFDIWDLASLELRKSVAMPKPVAMPQGVRFSHFHPDGKHFIGFLFAGDPDSGEVAVADIETGRIELTLRHADRRWIRTAMAADGRTLVTATTHAWEGWTAIGPSTLHVWELSSARECLTITMKERGSDDDCDRVALAPDCRTMVTVSQHGTLRFWDMLTGEEVLHRGGAPARVTSVAFSPDSKLLATGHADSTILLWDVSSIGTHYQSQLTHADAQQVAAWWEDLASSDARTAHQAVGRLVAAGAVTTALLRTKLVPATEGRGRVARLIADLDHESFDRREKASRELEALLPQARPALLNALSGTPSPEARRRIELLLAVPTPVVRDLQSLRHIRGIQVLEQLAAQGPDAARLDALDLLKKLTAGAPEARLTQEATAAVDRLAKRVTARP
jgi:RNA polymerase sigma factor (sigma-70 family)